MSEPKWAFTCPECGGHRISIEARIMLIVDQNPETGEFETYPSDNDNDNEPNYDRDDWACCMDCDHDEQLKYFEVT